MPASTAPSSVRRRTPSLLSWSLVVLVLALPALVIAGGDKPDWRGVSVPFEVECSCGEARGKDADPCPTETIKSHVKAPINATPEAVDKTADKHCEIALGTAKICSRVSCKIDSTSNELDLDEMFDDEVFKSDFTDTKFDVMTKDRKFWYEAEMTGSSVEFSIKTKDWEDGVKLGEAPPPLVNAKEMYRLAFHYFASKGNPVETVEGSLGEVNFAIYKEFKEGLKDDTLDEKEVFAKFIKTGKGTPKYWIDHKGRKFTKVVKADLKKASIEFEVELGTK